MFTDLCKALQDYKENVEKKTTLYLDFIKSKEYKAIEEAVKIICETPKEVTLFKKEICDTKYTVGVTLERDFCILLEKSYTYLRPEDTTLILTSTPELFDLICKELADRINDRIKI